MDEKLNDLNNMNSAKRSQKPVQNYEPSFENKRYKTYTQVVKDGEKNIDEITFVQVLAKVFQQMSLKAGIKKHGEKAIEGLTRELRQIHLRNSFIPKKRNELTKKQWQSRCEVVNLIKEKK